MSERKKGPGQIVAVDLVRFFAAVLVLLSHLAFAISARKASTPYAFSGGAIESPILPQLSFYGWIGVQIFFVISGMVIAFSSVGSSPWKFTRSRFLRLVPAAWICATLSLIIGGLAMGVFDWRGYRHSMLFLPWAPYIDSSYWTLSVEVFFYFGVYVLLKMGRIGRLRTYADGLVFVSLAYHCLRWIALEYQVMGILVSDSYLMVRSMELLLVEYGVFFGIGIYAYLANSEAIPSGQKFWFYVKLLLAVAVGFMQINAHCRMVSEDVGFPSNSVIPCLIWLICLLIIWNGVWLNRYLSNKKLAITFRYVGLTTYPLYLLHQNIGAVLMGYLVRHSVVKEWSLFLVFITIFLLSLFVVKYAEPILRTWVAKILDRISALTLPRRSSPN